MLSEADLLDGKHEPVAIIGMGCRWAGGIRDPSGLWELLRNKRDGWQEFADPRFSSRAFHHPSQDRSGSMRTKGGFLVEEDARLFDNAFFGITGREVETMDPSQRKLLEVVYEAFENGGETWDSISGSRTGVYIGNFALDHLLIQARDWESPKSYAATGADTSILANRISYIFNLHGPSLSTNTACSSSMYALHMAVSAIRNGDCDGAIVAAANWISDPSMQFVLDKLGALSPTSRCHTFDASADGYARGEGYAALYLKKSSIAVLDQLPIRAMIRGTAINANGRTGGITRPSIAGQEDVIRKAYESAGSLPFSDTTFFECHGTGTQAGDPIEVSAVGNVFSSSRSEAPEDRLLIGSIKPNLGHTEGASAIASVMKVVLSLEAGEIPPTYGVEILNPQIDFDKAKVEVVRDSAVPWPEGKVRRASINSFGFGGANGHCIIDHVNVVLPNYVKPGVIRPNTTNGYGTNGSSNGHSNGHLTSESNGNSSHKSNGHPTSQSPAYSNNRQNGNGAASSHPRHSPVIFEPKGIKKADATTRELVLLPFSAHNATSLQQNINALTDIVNQQPLADIAYTLGCKRSRLQQRSYRIVKQDNPVQGLGVENRILASPIQTTNVAFVFTGQGAQWHGMGAQLFEYDVFKAAIAYLDFVLGSLPMRPLWSISDILSGDCEPDLVQSPEVSQVVCTAVQIGLVDLLASWSVRPAAVVGHSSGEMAAAYASGHITAAEAITAAYFRGRAVSKNTQKGAMLAVGLHTDQVSAYLSGKEDQVTVAAINSPGSVTLSGDEDAVKLVSDEMTKDGVFNRLLRTGGSAYHSHHMMALGSSYSAMLLDGLEHISKVALVNQTELYPVVPWISSVRPYKAISTRGVTAAYWRSNLESTVRFSEAVTKMMSLVVENGAGIDVLLEIGPHPALKGPLDQILKGIGKPFHYASTLTRNQDSRESMLHLAGTLFGANATIDLAAVNGVDSGMSGDGTKPTWTFTHGCTAVNLPAYKFTYGPVSYYESRASKEYRLRKTIRHDLIGSRVPGTSKLQPQWRNVLRVKELPWLSDHRLLPDAVFPAAGFIAMAIEGATSIHTELQDPLKITGYVLRKIDIKTALRFPEDDSGVEIIFSMETTEQMSATSPALFHFTISSVSRDSSEWTEHCTGLVKVEVSKSAKLEKMNAVMDARFPDVAAWYKKFADIGLGYGPTFQPLSRLRTDPTQNLAEAEVALNTTNGIIEGGESSYIIHPASLDATFQLGLIACYGGQWERANTAFVPVHLSQMYLKAGPSQESGTAIAQGKTQGLRGAYIDLQMQNQSGEVVLKVDKLRCISFKESKASAEELQAKKAFSSPMTRLAWKPDMRSLNNRQIRELFPPPVENREGAASLEVVDMICCLVVADIYETFVREDRGPRPEGELRHWVSWIRRCFEEDDRQNMIEARQLSASQRRQKLQDLYAEAGDRPEAEAARRLQANIAEILKEEKSGIDVLVPGGLLTSLYEIGHVISGSFSQLFNVMDGLAHANPNMRVLEIGAGTGSATRVAMKALVGPNGIKRYVDYTFTDISAGFLTSARENMSEYHDVNFSVLDIEQDPLTNGYEPVYDVVLACEAIHATANMDTTLQNCRRLLKPGGKLVLVESTRMRVLLGLLYGTLTGYWLGAKDGRTEGPFMNLQTWDLRLRQNGFSGTELVLDDYDEPHNTTSIIVSTVRSTEDATSNVGQNAAVVHLLHDVNGPPLLVGKISQELKRRGVISIISEFDQASHTIDANARVVAFLSSHNDLFEGGERRLKSYQHLARCADSMIWITSCGITKGKDPRGAFMIGLLRTIGTENPSGRFLSIDIDCEDFQVDANDIDDLIHNVVDHEFGLQRPVSDEEAIDGEFTWQDGCMWVSRVVPDAGQSTYAETVRAPTIQGATRLPLQGLGPVRAMFETPGILSSIYFRAYNELLQPIPADYIDVKVDAVGLNWKDLGLSSGRFDANGSNLSSEYAGVIIKVGSNVTGLSVGDRVYGVGRGHFGNHTRVPRAFAQKLRVTDDSLEVATMPLVYMTALYALEHVTRLRKGQKVLIQSATGGLGLAALQIASLKGAEIFATVGSSDKVEFLTQNMGIPVDHIFNSRDPKALVSAALATGTSGGFNVILSTVVGTDFMYESIKALAPMGHLVDVGRLDVLESKSIGMEMFQKNASFSSFDLNLVLDNDAELGSQLMARLDELYRAGSIAPINPMSVSDISDLDKTLTGFSKGTHIGKHVVSFQNPNSTVKVLQEPVRAVFNSEGRYVITGGLGGLGRGIIRWMVARGARDFVILSRRGVTTPAAQLLLQDLTSMGVHFEATACDVSKQKEVIDSIRKASSSAGRPIKGVVHAAMSLSDLSFDKLTADQWRDGFAAKALGTLNLHEATASLPLDFFIMVTSTESIWAPPTQASYIAANNFQDYFARYRRRLGLPASTVAYGLVSDVGSDFRHKSVGTDDMYVRNKTLTISEHQVLAQLEPAFLDSSNITVGNGDGMIWIGKEQDPLSAANLFTCLDPVALAVMATTTTNEPRWYSDGRVSLIMRAMKDAQRHAKGSDTANGVGSNAGKSALTQLRDAFEAAVKTGSEGRAAAIELVTEGIIKTVAEMLFIDISNVNPTKSVADHGVDSLIAAELRNWFHQALKVKLQMQSLLDASTSIKALAEDIVDKALKDC